MIRASLVVGALYLVARLATDRLDPSPQIQRIIRIGLGLRFLGVFGRRWIISAVYGGVSDSAYYFTQAEIVVRARREGIDPRFLGYTELGPETKYLIRILATVYEFTGVHQLAGFLVFALFGWVGSVCFYKGAVIAFPGIDRKRYAWLVFAVPTLIYWPSSVGKDAWMLMTLGITALGAGFISRRFGDPRGLALLAVGMYGASLLRGHLVAIAAVAFVGAQLWPRRGATLGRTIIIGVLALGVLTFASRALTTTLGTETDGGEGTGLSATLARTTAQTGEGGSAFKPIPASTPLTLPIGMVTVLFRPFPLIDSRSPQQLVGAVESFTLLVLTYKSRKRLRHLYTYFKAEPHVRFAAMYTIAFVIPFSYIANFGILARQRTQLLPLFLVLLALPELAVTPPGNDSPVDGPTASGVSTHLKAGPKGPLPRRLTR